MISPSPITLEGSGIRLEPLTPDHESSLAAAASDGKLWELWYTSVPEPSQVSRVHSEIADALANAGRGDNAAEHYLAAC